MNLLYNSKICRLCGEENAKGTNIFITEEPDTDISVLINRYLPIKIYDDGNFPNWICPACRLQLDTTVQFFDLLVTGQETLRLFLKNQYDQQKRILLQGKPQSLLRNGFIEPEYLHENTLEGPFLFPPDHSFKLKVEGLEKPRKKRGRPPKPTITAEVLEAQRLEQEALLKAQKIEENKDISETEDNDGNRKRRRIKIPSRFQEAVQGKELERIYIEKGVIDKVEGTSETEDTYEDDNNQIEGEYRNEVIGHLQGKDGSSMGDLVFVKTGGQNRGKKNYTKKGKTKFICDICNKSFLHELKFMAHRVTHHNVRFECIHCLEQFQNRKLLSEHQQETKHQGEGIIECMQGETDKSETELNSIINEKENTEVNSIDEGVANLLESLEENNQINVNKEFLIVHNEHELISYQMKDNNNDDDDRSKEEEHDKTVNLITNDNNINFDESSTFNQDKTDNIQSSESIEQPLVESTTYKCDICPRSFNHPGSLLYHKESKHNNARKFLCSKCDKSFSHRLLLQRHQNVHSNEKNYSCNICPAKFKTKTNLKYHLCKHSGLKSFKCNICEQLFTHKNSLTIHCRLHNGQKPFKCETCGKFFNQNGNLQEHIRIHTGEKPYKCTHCDKFFTTSSQCKLHIRRHLGERKYECDICKKSFLYMETYKTHMRRHNNERPFVCNICSRGFTDCWSLKKHSRLHTGEKPYLCKPCGKKFSDCSNLTKHRKTHCIYRNTNVTDGTVTKNDKFKTKTQTEVSEPIIIHDTVDGLENNQIIYFTYDDPNDSNDLPIHVMRDPEEQYIEDLTNAGSDGDENTVVINNDASDGQNSMIFTVRKDNELEDENLEVTDSNNYSAESILEFSQTGANVLYELQATDEFSEHQTIEYITGDGRKVQLLNYSDPTLDLEPEYMEIS